MSEYGDKYRSEAMKSRVAKLTGKAHEDDVDASGWKEPKDFKIAQTGMRYVSKRQFTKGGKVHGEKAMHHAGRRARATGGEIADAIMNRNMKVANEKRAGEKQVGGMNHGGKIKKAGGGDFEVPAPQNAGPLGGGLYGMKSAPVRSPLLAKGGNPEKRAEGDGNWIEGATKNKGALHKALGVPEGKKIPAKKEAKAEHSRNPKIAKEARLAETLRGFGKGRADGGEIKPAPSTPPKPDSSKPDQSKFIWNSMGDRVTKGGKYDDSRTARASGGKATKKGTTVNVIIGGPKEPPMMPPMLPPGPPMPPAGSPMVPPGAMPPPPMPNGSTGMPPRGP